MSRSNHKKKSDEDSIESLREPDKKRLLKSRQRDESGWRKWIRSLLALLSVGNQQGAHVAETFPGWVEPVGVKLDLTEVERDAWRRAPDAMGGFGDAFEAIVMSAHEERERQRKLRNSDLAAAERLAALGGPPFPEDDEDLIRKLEKLPEVQRQYAWWEEFLTNAKKEHALEKAKRMTLRDMWEERARHVAL